MLPAAAQPQVAMIHQELYAVLFRCDRIRIFFRNALHHFRIFDIQLEAAGRPCLGPHFARYDHRALLC